MSSQSTQRNLLPNLSLFDYEPPTTQTQHSEAYSPSLQIAPEPETPTDNVIVLPRAEYRPRVLEDRWYQTNALEEIDRRLPLKGKRKGGKGELLVCPTGGGKTSIASRAIGKWLEAKKRVLILVDLERLLEQMREDLAEEGIYPLIEKAEHSALSQFGRHGNCVLASMQTLYTTRLQKWAADSFDYIVVDEAHELRWCPITNYFASAQLLGLTATPKDDTHEYFHHPYIKTLSLREAIEGWNANTQSYDKPFLSRIEVLPVDASHIDLKGVKVVGRDFDANEMDKRIWEHTNWLASAIIEATEGRRPWIYCPKIPTADALAKALRDMGKTAAAYHSKTGNPGDVLQQFIRDEVQYLTNVNMLIKGINVPKVDCIVRVRPSLNIAQATQEIGRGTRLSPQTGKKNCLIVEFGFDAGGKRLVGVLDAILDGSDDPDRKVTKEESAFRQRVLERAERIVKTKEEMDAILAFDKAKEQLSAEDAEKKRLKEEARLAKNQRVEVGVNLKAKYDPFAGLNKLSATSSAARPVTPATAEQMAQLEHLSGGVIKQSHAKQWTEEAACKRIEALEIRARYKLATEKQLRMMIDTMGMDPKRSSRMNKFDASRAIEERKLEMVHALDSDPRCSYDYESLIALPPWKVAPLYNQIYGSAA